jgi:type IV secretory pathway VirB2 component (pilin)
VLLSLLLLLLGVLAVWLLLAHIRIHLVLVVVGRAGWRRRAFWVVTVWFVSGSHLAVTTIVSTNCSVSLAKVNVKL